MTDMASWVKRLLGFAEVNSDGQEQASLQARAPAPAVQHDSVVAWNLPEQIDTLFFQSLVGTALSTDAATQPVARAVHEAFERQLRGGAAGNDLIPRVPTVIPHLLQSLRNENISGAALSQEIARDITLVSDVLRQANSSFYNLRTPVTSIEHALLVIGKNSLRLLIAKAAFRPVINIQSGRFTRVVAPYLWDQSDKCAFACRILAQAERTDPFAAFLAGLMQNVGMIVAFRLVDQVHEGGSLPATEQFRYEFLHYARRLSAQTAAQWDLPQAVRQILDELGEPLNNTPRSMLAGVVHASDQLSKLRILINQGHLPDDGAQLIAALPQGAAHCLRQLNEAASG
jgi:HD-like signal output (HDOD) protein